VYTYICCTLGYSLHSHCRRKQLNRVQRARAFIIYGPVWFVTVFLHELGLCFATRQVTPGLPAGPPCRPGVPLRLLRGKTQLNHAPGHAGRWCSARHPAGAHGRAGVRGPRQVTGARPVCGRLRAAHAHPTGMPPSLRAVACSASACMFTTGWTSVAGRRTLENIRTQIARLRGYVQAARAFDAHF